MIPGAGWCRLGLSLKLIVGYPCSRARLPRLSVRLLVQTPLPIVSNAPQGPKINPRRARTRGIRGDLSMTTSSIDLDRLLKLRISLPVSAKWTSLVDRI
jgi:hypothetical protein